MSVLRIVPNFYSPDPDSVRSFYEKLLGLKVLMDMSFIHTYGSEATTSPQISIMSEGGSGTPVPDISVEVTDVDAIYKKAKSARFQITYDITDEPWGVRRFFVCDPTGRIVNILSHIKS